MENDNEIINDNHDDILKCILNENQRTKDFLENIFKEFSILRKSINQQNNVIESLNSKIDAQSKEINSLKEIINHKTKEIGILEKNMNKQFDETKKETDRLSEASQYCCLQHKTTKSQLKIVDLKIFKPIDLFIWKIYDFSAKRKRNGVVYSECFYSHRDGYKMWLCLFSGGTDVYRGTHLSLQFQILKSENCKKLTWPFKGCLTIGIINQATSEFCLRIKQECQIEKELDFSPLFNFIYEDLVKLNAFQNDTLIIQSDLLDCDN